ncbi:hypothetical protein OA493_02135 [Gammaproteobacteria bacterium]|jgi:hypothetical protein|nr:hypothetical protein [Gammaproteobacteria bacterium]|tara:strand:- start:284 stop:499 length:216 start_codon:yes stop_codon:yes gene_type:complete
MDEKQFLITALQLIDVSLARGAIRGEEVKIVSQLRDYIGTSLQKYQEQIAEPVETLAQEAEVEEVEEETED